MEITIVAVGRLKAGPESELCARYLDRAKKSGRALGFRGFDVQEIAESRAPRAAGRISQEDEGLVAALGRGGRVICLHAEGELLDSEEFARWLGRGAASVAHTTFVIGGPDGLGEKVRGLAERQLSFGRLTWPHQMVRVMLAEQLYRAMTIISGHPYHRV